MRFDAVKEDRRLAGHFVIQAHVGARADLLLAIAAADRGEMVSAEEVLAKLARRHGWLSHEGPGHEASARAG